MTGHGTSKIFGFPARNNKHMCWMCKSTSCDTMPYWDLSECATWRTSRYKPGAFFQSTKACNISCQSTIQLSKVHFGQGLHWCYALCGLGVTQEVLGNIFSEYLEKGGLQMMSQTIRCETLWVKLKTDPDLDCDQVQKGRWNNSIFQGKGNRDKALGTIWCIAGPRAL